MSNNKEDLFAKELVYKIDGMQDVNLKQNLPYTADRKLTIDIYYPKDTQHDKPQPRGDFRYGLSRSRI